ncbi:hypothetical protein 8014-B2_0067 [Lactobacillus phage ATCC 8014-B2]|uniref:Uncharacterized protein n=1 Tax=Lactobacillus phage ATCC 8014-B2 TaxID=1225795 RepID=K4ID76_9CAUD|nr:hypothetical protein HOQ89_gp079 [Lactobacillus phage ATCC 8014-B2]AFU63134.1 hypothetical protein 8014-B2_0067 [Lactobacillus phage ATCC 8014-B2]
MTELLEQIWYYQDRVAELEEQSDELKLENDDLRYKISEMESAKDEKQGTN